MQLQLQKLTLVNEFQRPTMPVGTRPICETENPLTLLTVASSGTFSPDLALHCARSIPFNQTACRLQLVEIRNFLAFQSSQDYWKNAPTNLTLPVFDLSATLDTINSKIESSAYATKYDFDIDIREALVGFHDAHTLYWTSVISSFVYYHRYPLISISQTPDSQPDIYLADLMTGGPKMDCKVTKINGQDATAYLLDLATKATNPAIYVSDIDTRYNQLFVPQVIPELRGTQLENLGLFANRDVYPTDTPKITLSNGTAIKVQWHAMYNYWYEENLAQPPMTLPFYDQASFENIARFDTFTGPPKQGQPSASKIKFMDGLNPYSPGPTPIRRLAHNEAAYYTLGSSIGIIRFPTFGAWEFNTNASPSGYVNDVVILIDEALKYFKSKIIQKVLLDVTHNGGGDLVAGYAFFQRFFPSVTHPQIYQNMRWSPQLEAIVKVSSKKNESDSLPTELTSWSIAYNDVPSTNQPFSSVEAYLGSSGSNTNSGAGGGGRFTRLANKDFLASIKAFRYNSQLPPSQNLFPATQLALLSDTLCGSTCSTFSQMMRDQGVRTVAYGGRPGRTSLQISGGVKGRQLYTYYDWLRTSSEIPNTVENNRWLPKPPPYGMALSVNLINGFVGAEAGQLPREMVYEGADKAVFLTEEMSVRVDERWKVAAGEIWG